jgi:diacylglycerol kinase family enzyme
MYYFIFEPTSNRKLEKIEEDIKFRASELGIDGEFLTLSLAEKPENLARIGLQKDYHTIVAVGSDALINSVGQGLIGTDAALGAIPLEENSIFLPLIGVRDWKEALEVLPQRKIEKIDTILLNRSFRIITQVEIAPAQNKMGVIVLAFDGYFRAEISERRILVSNLGVNLTSKEDIIHSATDRYLDVFIPGKTQVQKKWWQVFGSVNQEDTVKGSIFHPKFLEVNSKLKLKAYVNGKSIATGPFLFEVDPRTLQFIIKRSKNLKTNEDTKNEQSL